MTTIRLTGFRIIAQDQHGNMLIMKRCAITGRKQYWLKHKDGKVERARRELVEIALRVVKPLFIRRSNTRAFAYQYETEDFPLAQGAGLHINPFLPRMARKSKHYSLSAIDYTYVEHDWKLGQVAR